VTVFLFCTLLAGLPAAMGVFLILCSGNGRNLKAGGSLLAYSIVLAGMFSLLLPDGKILVANFSMKMPSAMIIGMIVGGLAAAFQRAKSRN
jgi:hypothetical protein